MSISRKQIDDATIRWTTLVASPYIIAYNDAYANFQAALAAQEEANKSQAELFGTVAAIMTTSILMAALASGPFRRLASRIGARALAQKNLQYINSFYAQSSSNPIIDFAFGKAKDYGFDQTKAVAAKLIQNTAAGVTASSPLSRSEQIKSLIALQGLAISDMSDGIRADRARSVADREKGLADLSRSPFMNPPKDRVDDTKLRPIIELGMFMQLVLDTDYLRIHYPADTRIPSQRAGGINIMPTDPKYPKTKPNLTEIYRSVEIDRPGNDIQEAIDKVHKEVKKVPFYQHGRYLGMQWPGGKADELTRADRVLQELSKATRPKFATDVQFKFP